MFIMTYTPCRNIAEDGTVHELGTLSRACDSCLEYNNACRTLLTVQYDYQGNLDKELNQKGGSARAHHFVHEYSLQEHFVFLKRLEAITAETSYLYSQKIIRERISDPAIIKRARDPQEFQKAVEQQKLSRRPEKERKQLDARGKAIQGLMNASGLDEATAASIVDEQFKKQGKVTA